MAAPRHRPRLGQHFLHDRGVLGRIAGALPLGAGATVVEIGPGRGALTSFLLESGARVVAVEVDSALADGLRERFAGQERFRLVEADFLEVDFADLTANERVSVAGNLPYYITSPIVRKTLDEAERVAQAVFLVQKEVADRIVASKGSRDYAYLSALCRLRAEPELLFRVRPGAFRPPPRVESAVVRLKMRPGEGPLKEFVEFLSAAFRAPRKTLRNNLASLYGRERIAAFPEASLRAQQMDVEELRSLWRRISAST